MNGARQSAAEDTAAILVHAEWSASPVMIPGAFEMRGSRGATSLPPVPAETAAVRGARTIAPSNHERLDHEREDGGAPNERRGRRSGTLAARLWHSLLHLMDIWRRVLPQTS